ncbi:NAD(P)-binding protein [Stemphylium lycopersici]|nr:NAD(P)-binding protein [Stemphylium lycopersici]
MASSFSTPNTSPTPTSPGHWLIPKFGTPSVLEWHAFDPLALLTPTSVLIRILVAGIAGTDNIQRAGGYPHPTSQKPGFTPGYDLVGEIVALGDAVPEDRGLKTGDRVAALSMFGAHATHIAMPWDQVLLLEKDDDALKMCALPLNYMTAWGMLKHSGADLKPGSTILLGAASGGLGTAAAQLNRAFDLGIRIIGTCSRGKFDYVRGLGVEPVDRTASDLVQQVLDLTGGEGVDLALDPVGSRQSVRNSLAVAKKDTGKVVIYGAMANIAPDGSGMLENRDQLLGEILQPPRVTFWHLDTDFPKKKEVEEFYAVVSKVREGRLDPVIAKVMRLKDEVEAHQMLIDGSATKGKMLFVVDEELAKKYGV